MTQAEIKAEEILKKHHEGRYGLNTWPVKGYPEITAAMEEYSAKSYQQGAKDTLKAIAKAFSDGIVKADNYPDSVVFQAIAETIEKFPIPQRIF